VRVEEAMVRAPKVMTRDATVESVQELFRDDHIQMALIVAANGVLLTTIERCDLDASHPNVRRAADLGTLRGRVVTASTPLPVATRRLRRARRRRLAVVDEQGELLGLLCLTRKGDGYCSDEGIRQRASAR
jgi:CBS domain containing-hemolysin-like protein